MTASIKHILINVERMANDGELLDLWNREAQAKKGGQDRTVQQTWLAFIKAADEAKIADRIPGTVGRTFKSRYDAHDDAGPLPLKRASRKRSATVEDAE